MALPNQAHWFVDLSVDGLMWCFGRGWDLFAQHARFGLDDQLMVSYQGDGLFIVSILDVAPLFPFLGEQGNVLSTLSSHPTSQYILTREHHS